MTIVDCIAFLANIIAVIGIPITAYQIIKGRSELKKSQEKKNKEERRKNEDMQIILKEKNTNRKIYLPNKIRRGELTRAEVLGRLGMMPMIPVSSSQSDTPKKDQRRFLIKKNATEEFIRAIDALYVSSEGKELIVNCDTEEMEQFDIEEIKKLGFDVRGFDL